MVTIVDVMTKTGGEKVAQVFPQRFGFFQDSPAGLWLCSGLAKASEKTISQKKKTYPKFIIYKMRLCFLHKLYRGYYAKILSPSSTFL